MAHDYSLTVNPHIAVDPWGIAETGFDAEVAALHETLFALGNGQIGVRGAQEEGDVWAGTMQNDVFINGFYESEPIVYPESAYGFAKTNQFIVRVPNATGMTFTVNNLPFDPSTGSISDYQRRMDFQTGVLSRSFVWTTPAGLDVKVYSERLVSFTHAAVVAVRYTITPLNGSANIEIHSTISNKPRAVKAGDDPRVGASLGGSLSYVDFAYEADFSAFTHKTHHSDLYVVSSVMHDISPDQMHQDDLSADHVFNRQCAANEGFTVTKLAAYVTSQHTDVADLVDVAETVLQEALVLGFDGLTQAQTDYLSAFWRSANVEIGGDASLQQGMRFGQFHLLQSAGQDGKTNIAAKGVTGAGYDGHYFWDTEIYVLPFFLHTRPEIARKLIEYRIGTLDAARTRAREMAHPKGALYPWRTITGPECSSYFPAGTAQYHINADIAYALRLYTDVTGDRSLLLEQGAEMLFETARIWPQLGAFDAQGHFGIYTVTGPDEYTAIVNNNVFTNSMARHHMQFAGETAAWLQSQHPDVYAQITHKIGLNADELDLWARASEHMVVLYDTEKGIHPQDDTFMSKPVWDFAGTPKDHYPLLLNYHPLVIYRHQVCKQPDVVLALMLLGHEFDSAAKKRDYDYYEAITTHDSSLSSCIFSIMAGEVGYHEKAYDYFMQTARLDLDNLHHNTQHGVHAAALAGSWMSVVYGFAGMRSFGGVAKFKPFLPTGWTHYQFVIRIGHALLQVRVEPNQTIYQLLQGEILPVEHCGTVIDVTPHPLTVPNQ